ncbi:MAG: alpha/beta family hydrolase [Anaeromyxobacteraceae bacterium]
MRPLVLFAPGAGAPSTSPWMERWAARLATLGEVRRFDYPYMLAGRRSPDRLPALVAAHREALAAARGSSRRPVVLAGKSMGSRVGCHVALEEAVRAVVCLGYPLRSPRGELRKDVLLALRTPVLFVQGARDPLCPLDALEEVRRGMAAPSALHVVPGGNHSLEVGARELRARGETQEEVDARALAAIAWFVAERGAAGARGEERARTARYVAFLRGVSPSNAKMPELAAAFEAAGFAEARTVLSSGNVVFAAPPAPLDALARRAEAAMEARLGRAFPAIVREVAELRRLLAAEPFAAFRLPAAAKRVVTFLRAAPARRPALPIEREGARILAVVGREVLSAYVPGPRGPVFMTLIEKAFGKDVTTRTWETVQKVAAAAP